MNGKTGLLSKLPSERIDPPVNAAQIMGQKDKVIKQRNKNEIDE